MERFIVVGVATGRGKSKPQSIPSENDFYPFTKNLLLSLYKFL